MREQRPELWETFKMGLTNLKPQVGGASVEGENSEFVFWQDKYANTSAITRFLLENFFSTLRGLLRETTPQSVLEAGCGEGFSTRVIRGTLPPQVRVEAGDVEDELVVLARKNNPGVQFQQESIYQLNHEANSFDLVVSLEVFEHLEEPEKALAEVTRVSNRWVLLSVPNEPLWCALNFARLKYVRHLGNTPGHINHWSPRAFRKFVETRAKVIELKTPLPWTMLLAEVKR